MKRSFIEKAGLLILFLTVCYFPLFLHLNGPSIVLWDEARLAVKATEMAKGSSWIVPHFMGKPDMWSLKPPLLLWIQAIFLKVFGFNELGIRLPSAIAALGTALLLFLFSSRTLKKPIAGFLAGVVLVTFDGYVERHLSSTGDYDSLLIFFITAFCLSYSHFLFSESRKDELKWMSITAVLMMMAALIETPIDPITPIPA